MLTDLEFRVWIQYLLSSDDFGVMPMSVSKLKSDNHHLENRPIKQLQRCLDALVKAGLVRPFMHQGRHYIYQHDWQKWQKVEYPRRTNNPKVPDAALEECDEPTRALLGKWPGGERRKNPRTDPSHSERASRTHAEDVPTTRAGAPAERLTATGERQVANGFIGVEGELVVDAPMDVWARELVNLAPKEGRCGALLVERPLFNAIQECKSQLGALDDRQAYVFIRERLEQHARSHQWRVKGMVKRLDRWLSEGLYLQELAEEAPAAQRMSRTTSVTAQAAAEIMKEPA